MDYMAARMYERLMRRYGGVVAVCDYFYKIYRTGNFAGYWQHDLNAVLEL
jgi:hypothetical protein